MPTQAEAAEEIEVKEGVRRKKQKPKVKVQLKAKMRNVAGSVGPKPKNGVDPKGAPLSLRFFDKEEGWESNDSGVSSASFLLLSLLVLLFHVLLREPGEAEPGVRTDGKIFSALKQALREQQESEWACFWRSAPVGGGLRSIDPQPLGAASVKPLQSLS
jgi:hypothetical protein